MKPALSEIPRGYTYEEVAERFGTTPRIVQRMCDEGRLGFFKLSRGRRITENHIREYIARNSVDPVA